MLFDFEVEFVWVVGLDFVSGIVWCIVCDFFFEEVVVFFVFVYWERFFMVVVSVCILVVWWMFDEFLEMGSVVVIVKCLNLFGVFFYFV